jgi:hypothetical protein
MAVGFSLPLIERLPNAFAETVVGIGQLGRLEESRRCSETEFEVFPGSEAFLPMRCGGAVLAAFSHGKHQCGGDAR